MIFAQYLEKIRSDVEKTWRVILNYLLLTSIPCVAVIAYIHRIAKPLVWGSIITVLIASGLGMFTSEKTFWSTGFRMKYADLLSIQDQSTA